MPVREKAKDLLQLPNRRIRSISVPITLGAVTLPLAAALLVGWTTFLARRISETGQVERDMWLIILGAAAFVVIMTVLVLFSYFLAREILEVRRQDSFIDSVTHELKSPLASIKLCSQTLERTDLPDDKRETVRRMIYDDVERLSSFIDDVLQASRLAHDAHMMNWQVIDAAKVLRDVAQQVTARHHVTPARIHIDAPETLPMHSDAAAFEIIARNLIDNAVKYSKTSAEPRIDVRIALAGTRVELVVSDNGIGIEKSERKRVFHRFYRVESENVRKQKGTGLGLFVVSSLVRNLGGRVWNEAAESSTGTRFIVHFPELAKS